MSLLGLNRRLRAASLGFLAAFEATSSSPSRKIAGGLERLGFPAEMVEYYTEHVEADLGRLELRELEEGWGYFEVDLDDIEGTLDLSQVNGMVLPVFGAQAMPDTVEFKLGGLVLGKVKGAAIITPMELAGDSENRLQNLLILLQSLDVDGNPDNGISIPANAAAAVTAEATSAAGPYDRWPLGRGFERYYGFLGGDTHQYYPDLVYDNHQVEPPATPEEGYHLTVDLADKAIEFIADLKQALDPPGREQT